MKNLKVPTKLFSGFGIAMAFILAVGLVSIFNLNPLNGDYTKTIDSHGKPSGDAAHILESKHAIRAEMRLANIYTGNAEILNRLAVELEDTASAFKFSSMSDKRRPGDVPLKDKLPTTAKKTTAALTDRRNAPGGTRQERKSGEPGGYDFV
jgi:hypothetical protein